MDKTFLDMPSGFQERRRPHPNENFATGNRISIVFFEFYQGYFFNVKKRTNTGSVFPPQKRRIQFFSFFFTVFDKSTGHSGTKFYPVSYISITYKSYIMFFFLQLNFFKSFFIYTLYALLRLLFLRRRDGAVVRAVESRSKISGSNPTAAFFAFFSSANAGLRQMRKTEFFWTKKAPPFFEK